MARTGFFVPLYYQNKLISFYEVSSILGKARISRLLVMYTGKEKCQ